MSRVPLGLAAFAALLAGDPPPAAHGGSATGTLAASGSAAETVPPAAAPAEVTVLGRREGAAPTPELVVRAARACVFRARPGDGEPHVIDTYPHDGQVVSAGLTFVTFVFDRPVSPCRHNLSTTRDSAYTPRYRGTLGSYVLYSADLRRVYYLYDFGPRARIGLALNSDCPTGFESLWGGAPLRPFRLSFRTSEVGRRDPDAAARAVDDGNSPSLHGPLIGVRTSDRCLP